MKRFSQSKIDANENPIIEKRTRGKKKITFEKPIIEQPIIEESIIDEQIHESFKLMMIFYLD